jgi:hypothetical protein
MAVMFVVGDGSRGRQTVRRYPFAPPYVYRTKSWEFGQMEEAESVTPIANDVRGWS